MTNKNKCITILSAIFLLFMSACSDDKSETKKISNDQSKAVSKKIEKKIEPTQTETVNDKTSQAPINVKENPEISGKPEQKAEVPQQAETEKTIAVNDKAQEQINDDSVNKEFDPTGKLNPFLPFVSDDDSEEDKEKTENTKKKREPLTPLEKIDIGRLRLTAITRTPSGNIALVEEANGKGYVLNEGTYIGLNSGKVISVLSDKVIIEEEIENIFGKVSIQERELKLQKPTGE